MVLYASANVPALNTDPLPVGFGSNIPGVSIPSDFQYPGGGRLQSIPDTSNPGASPPADSVESGSSLTDKLSSSFLKSDASHRVPGFIFFLFIVIIALFYLCGRERRSRFYSNYLPLSLHAPSGKPMKSPSSRLFHLPSLLQRIFYRQSSNNGHIDLEDGSSTRLYNPADFELDDMNDSDDDDFNPTHNNGTGPTFTSKLSNNFPSSPTSRSKRPKLTSSKSAFGLGTNSASHSSLGAIPDVGRLSPDHIMDRRGLVVRTESRDRLALNSDSSSIGGRISRSGSLSPSRLRSGRGGSGGAGGSGREAIS